MPAPVPHAEGGFQRHRGRRVCSGLFDPGPRPGRVRIDAKVCSHGMDAVITTRNLVAGRLVAGR
jgi:hypothetical protein